MPGALDSTILRDKELRWVGSNDRGCDFEIPLAKSWRETLH